MAVHQEASTGQIVNDGAASATNKTRAQQIDGKDVMAIRVYSPFHTYFDEAAFSMSAANASGPFDILPRHHNFICLLSPCELHIVAPSGEKRIKISGGVMHVKADQIRVFLDV